MTLLVRTIDDALRIVCSDLQIKPPRRLAQPGRYARTDTMERNGKGDAEIRIHDDGRGVEGVNWQTQARMHIRIGGADNAMPPTIRPDPEVTRRKQEERAAVERICDAIVKSCRQEAHPYLVRKGFPDELGLVHDDPRTVLPGTPFGEMLAKAMPESDGPMLIVPGRIGRRITTVQFIDAEGMKKNILGGRMGGAAHRIATGSRTVVCEGIATALSVRAALRLLNVPTTVLAAFSASNVAKVAAAIPGALIAADHDKPIEALDGLGTGEFYAKRSACEYTMPPEPGDFNDYHVAHGLRAVALHFRGAISG